MLADSLNEIITDYEENNGANLTHEVLTVTCLVHEILLIIRLDAAGRLEGIAGSVLVEIVRHDREVSHEGFAEIEDITGV